MDPRPRRRSSAGGTVLQAGTRHSPRSERKRKASASAAEEGVAERTAAASRLSAGADEGAEVEILDPGADDRARCGPAQYSAADVAAHGAGQGQADEPEEPAPQPGKKGGRPDAAAAARLEIASLHARVAELESGGGAGRPTCSVCQGPYVRPLVSLVCWHVHCEPCLLAALAARGLCPRCSAITMPADLRRIYL